MCSLKGQGQTKTIFIGPRSNNILRMSLTDWLTAMPWFIMVCYMCQCMSWYATKSHDKSWSVMICHDLFPLLQILYPLELFGIFKLFLLPCPLLSIHFSAGNQSLSSCPSCPGKNWPSGVSQKRSSKFLAQRCWSEVNRASYIHILYIF